MRWVWLSNRLRKQRVPSIEFSKGNVMGEIGIGIIGSGFMGRTYCETISKYCSRVRLVAVTAGSRAGQLAQDYEVAHEPSVESLLSRGDIGAVFIATPHDVH